MASRITDQAMLDGIKQLIERMQAEKAELHPEQEQQGTYIVRGPLSYSKEHQMADNKNPNEKQPGEKPEGKDHYNPGNQSGKEAKIVPKEDAKKDD
jgi:hypothetical protein